VLLKFDVRSLPRLPPDEELDVAGHNEAFGFQRHLAQMLE
jgi:hypothetical protein